MVSPLLELDAKLDAEIRLGTLGRKAFRFGIFGRELQRFSGCYRLVSQWKFAGFG
jgi:hypothetical protein